MRRETTMMTSGLRLLSSALVLALAILTACATGYHPQGFLGDGFSERKLGPALWVVIFDASAFTPRERIHDFLLLRCAEVTVGNGAAYFAILGEGAPKRVMPTKPSLIDESPFPIGDSSAAPILESKHSAVAAIQLYGEKPEEKVYDAREIIRRLTPIER